MPQVIVASPSESRLVRAGQSGGRIARVGPWELLRLVGGGSLSQVYQASPAGTPPERPAAYALKMPGPARQDDAAAVALLRQEAAAGRAVNHPHVVAILSASLGQPPYYLVIHGDVKPSNVFLSPDGHATLLDLGFARPIGAAHCLADRCVLGTPSYMAPELLTSASTADIRSDVYSLGVVLYEMLAGRLPFDAADLGALVSQHRQGSLPRLEKLAPWLPADVVRLVSRMLAKDLLRRPSPAELLRQLTAMEIAALAEAVDGGK